MIAYHASGVSISIDKTTAEPNELITFETANEDLAIPQHRHRRRPGSGRGHGLVTRHLPRPAVVALSLVVFPFKDEDPLVATGNVWIVARHQRVSAVLCVGSGRDAAYHAIEAVAEDVRADTGTPVRLILQDRLGTLRPGKGDAMNTGLTWFLDESDAERVHFYDADITTFGPDWITNAEEAAGRGFPVVRHYFPRASTDAMITWMITRPGLGDVLAGHARCRTSASPSAVSCLFTREVAEALRSDSAVQAQSDWGIDTRYTIATTAAGFGTGGNLRATGQDPQALRKPHRYQGHGCRVLLCAPSRPQDRGPGRHPPRNGARPTPSRRR